jgi:hypothetical protein
MRETELYEELYNLKHKEITIVLEDKKITVIPGREIKQDVIEDIIRVSNKHGAEVNLTSYAGKFEIKF